MIGALEFSDRHEEKSELAQILMSRVYFQKYKTTKRSITHGDGSRGCGQSPRNNEL
jgi:hypothetical protein